MRSRVLFAKKNRQLQIRFQEICLLFDITFIGRDVESLLLNQFLCFFIENFCRLFDVLFIKLVSGYAQT